MSSWIVRRGGRGRLQVMAFYGTPGNYSQYFVLHTESGYVRFVPCPECTWGTSVIVTPSYWTCGTYRQGMRCLSKWQVVRDTLIIRMFAKSDGLLVNAVLTVNPPIENQICTSVAVTVEGDVPVDERSGEAFKPVVLASMHNSPLVYDAAAAYLGSKIVPLSPDNWIVTPDENQTTNVFGFLGGSSDWKANAPTVIIEFDGKVQVSGLLTPENDPNGDNATLWAATPGLIRSWSYRIITVPVYPLTEA